MVDWKQVTIIQGKPKEVIDAKPLGSSIKNGKGIAFINESGNPLLLADLIPDLKSFMDLMVETQQSNLDTIQVCADTLELMAGFTSNPAVEGSPVTLLPSYLANINAKKTEAETLLTTLENLKNNLLQLKENLE